MRYFDLPTPELQRKPLVPQKLISGMLPGATEIRIGGNENIKISGKDQQISIVNSGTTLSFGNQGSGNLQLALSDGTTNIIKLGNLGSDYIGLAFNDSANDRVFIGKKPNGSYVAKLSQSGNDAKTAADDKLIWSSDFNLFKIVDVKTLSLTIVLDAVNPVYDITSTPHSLDYTPAYLAFIVLDPDLSAAVGYSGSNQVPNPFTLIDTGAPSLTPLAFLAVTVDDTNINFESTTELTGVGTFICTAKVYLMRETITG